MSDSLTELEKQRSQILAQLMSLGDFRRGSITPTKGRCGKANCRCHKSAQPGHGPNFRLTRKVNRKTVTETFSTPAAMQKAQREVQAFHRFQDLSKQLLEVNEKICRARPIQESAPPQEKKRPKPSKTKRRGK